MTLDSRSIPVQDVPGMDAHVNCRCTMVPRAKSYAEILGDPSLPDNRPKTDTGPEAFAKLDPAIQRSILGPGKFALYQRGVPLEAMWQTSASPSWGVSRVAKPLYQLRDEIENGEWPLTPPGSSVSPDRWRGLVDYEGEGGLRFEDDLAHHLGYDALPEVVSDAELDRHIAAGEEEMWRGVREYNYQGATEYADGLRTDPQGWYIGQGIWGQGSYWASGAEGKYGPGSLSGKDVSATFAFGYKGEMTGSLIRGTVKSGSRIAEWGDLEREWEAAIRDYVGSGADFVPGGEGPQRRAGHPSYETMDSLPLVLRDPGYFAAAQGYDGYVIRDSDRVGWPEHGDQYVIWNRGALRVSRSTITQGWPVGRPSA